MKNVAFLCRRSKFMAKSLSLIFFALILCLPIIDLSGANDEAKQCPFASKESKTTPRGHMKPFGQHTRQWLRVESRYDEVSPEEFYEKYVRPSKPVVIRGGIADWPAVERWPNLTYLGELSGDTVLNADWRRIYNDHEYLQAHAIRRLITMKEYIKRMNNENIYMDTPPTAPLLKEMMWPQLTNCEYFIKRMRAPSFFFNTGKSNTDIHIDGCETLFFQVSGSRLWLMTPPDNAPYMYSGEQYFPPHMGISAVNQRAVNLTQFPEMSKAILYAAVVNPGDLVYVPEAWFHNVMARGNPNIATTIFFDSSNCEKVFSASPDAEYVQACDRHRRIFLPSKIECPKKLPRGTSWLDVSNMYVKENPKLKPSKGYGSNERLQKRIEKLKNSKLWTKPLWDKSSLPRMVLDGDIPPLLETLPDRNTSILQLHYRFYSPRLEDIAPLAEHLRRFDVPRADVHFMLVLPHDVSGAGAAAAAAWLDRARAQFEPYPVAAIDLVLLEAPPCVPRSREAQDCERDAAIDEQRLAAWRLLEERLRAGDIRQLGVKDVSAEELRRLSDVAEHQIAVVCLRLDPLYRQMKLRKVAADVKAKVMVHSVTGSGWVRDGIASENPIHNLTSVMMLIFGDTGSLYGSLYEWTIRRGYFLIPDRTDNGVIAEINFDSFLRLIFNENTDKVMNQISQLVPEDSVGTKGNIKTEEKETDDEHD